MSESSSNADYTFRAAVSEDKAGILKVFEEVAPEVPTAIFPTTEGMIQRLVASGCSWVAADSDGHIVGYALAEPHPLEEAISLAYLGVSNTARDRRVSSSLVRKLQEAGAPIITDVRVDNKSSMVDRFEHFGFVKGEPDAFSEQRTKFRWEALAAKCPPI